jgi:hypothetical protein
MHKSWFVLEKRTFFQIKNIFDSKKRTSLAPLLYRTWICSFLKTSICDNVLPTKGEVMHFLYYIIIQLTRSYLVGATILRTHLHKWLRNGRTNRVCGCYSKLNTEIKTSWWIMSVVANWEGNADQLSDLWFLINGLERTEWVPLNTCTRHRTPCDTMRPNNKDCTYFAIFNERHRTDKKYMKKFNSIQWNKWRND